MLARILRSEGDVGVSRSLHHVPAVRQRILNERGVGITAASYAAVGVASQVPPASPHLPPLLPHVVRTLSA